MPLIYRYLIYVAFYTVQIHFDFYHFYRFYHLNTPTSHLFVLGYTCIIDEDSKDVCRSRPDARISAFSMVNGSAITPTSQIVNTRPNSTTVPSPALYLSRDAQSTIGFTCKVISDEKQRSGIHHCQNYRFSSYPLLDYYNAHSAQEGLALPRSQRAYDPHRKQACFLSFAHRYLRTTSLSLAPCCPASLPSRDLITNRTVSATVEILPDCTMLKAVLVLVRM
jgi:hypothetical protein